MRATLTLCVLATLAAGCGDTGGEEKAVREAVAQVQAALDERDYDAVCNTLDGAARRQLGTVPHGRPGDCWTDAAELDQRLREGGARRKSAAQVIDVAVRGNRADAIVELLPGGRSRVRLRKRAGRWRLESIYGNTAPPPTEFR